jgi:hypothetical protein
LAARRKSSSASSTRPSFSAIGSRHMLEAPRLKPVQLDRAGWTLSYMRSGLKHLHLPTIRRMASEMFAQGPELVEEGRTTKSRRRSPARFPEPSQVPLSS